MNQYLSSDDLRQAIKEIKKNLGKTQKYKCKSCNRCVDYLACYKNHYLCYECILELNKNLCLTKQNKN